jgi:hypothetical protein
MSLRRFANTATLIAMVLPAGVAACATTGRREATTHSMPGGLEISATTVAKDLDTLRALQTRVTVTNSSDSTVIVSYGACPVSLRVYDNAQRVGPYSWDSAALPSRDPSTGLYRGFCVSTAQESRLATGKSISPASFELTTPVGQIVGDSLPSGRYYLVARVRLSSHPLTEVAPDTVVDVPAGEVELP